MNEQKISMLLGALVVAVVGILIYNYFAQVNKDKQIAELNETSKVKTHTVAKGEYLWQIAMNFYQDGYKWIEIAKANELVNPDILTEGQVLVLPELETTPMLAGTKYVVQPGDFLWEISVKVYADGYQWTKIWEANQALIANPNLIETSMVLTIPR
ncbi:MAG: LysM peptidoglycan-binding domain-containing protein [Candidatus Beckwithbacteria bacterium]